MPDNVNFGDVFADVQFDDAKIDLSAEGGNADNPPAAKGQQSDSPPDSANQPADAKVEQDKGVKPEAKPEDKKVPYDQDPKWKKARAAEAALDALKEEFGILDVDELKAAIKQGVDLSKLLKGKDPAKLLEDAAYAESVRRNWDKEKQDKQFENESADERVARLQEALTKMQSDFKAYREGVESGEHASEVLRGFGDEVNRVIDVEGENSPFSDSERKLLSLFLGVENPSNTIDIEDRGAVRKMALQGVKTFKDLMKTIRQESVEKYLAEKKELAVDTSRGADAAKVEKPGAENTTQKKTTQQTPAPLTNDEVSQVFDVANNEFAEVLLKGIQGLI